MKKHLFRILSLAAFLVLMVYNVQVSETSSGDESTLTISAASNVAVAEEGGYGWDGMCWAAPECGGGVRMLCFYGGYYCVTAPCMSGFC